MNEVSLKPVIDELETLFSKFNKAFFEGKLEKPVITVSPDHTRGAYGWCTAWKAWQDGTKEGGYYEINLCAEYLNRPFEETCGTLLHEMVHLQNLQDNVQDTSRSGFYHNRKFKETAEAHGLTVEKGEKYGWHKTTLNPQAEAFVKSLWQIRVLSGSAPYQSAERFPEGRGIKFPQICLPLLRNHHPGHQGSSCSLWGM
jgi:hypothetical protein